MTRKNPASRIGRFPKANGKLTGRAKTSFKPAKGKTGVDPVPKMKAAPVPPTLGGGSAEANARKLTDNLNRSAGAGGTPQGTADGNARRMTDNLNRAGGHTAPTADEGAEAMVKRLNLAAASGFKKLANEAMKSGGAVSARGDLLRKLSHSPSTNRADEVLKKVTSGTPTYEVNGPRDRSHLASLVRRQIGPQQPRTSYYTQKGKAARKSGGKGKKS